MLWRVLGKQGNGFYIDAGACSPDAHSVTRLFSERGWRGINVEPDPEHHRALEQRRPRDINLCIALSDRAGRMPMHLFQATGLSTLDETIAARHRATYSERIELVEVRRLRDVWSEFVPQGQPVHFVKIDVEGFERQVIAGSDWQTQRPWIVVVEATKPLSPEPTHGAWEHILLEAGYLAVYFDGLNRFYLAREHEHLATDFAAPPNVFDGYVLSAQLAGEARIRDLENTLGQTVKQLERVSRELDVKRDEASDLRDQIQRADQENKRRRADESEVRRRQLERTASEAAARDQEIARLHNDVHNLTGALVERQAELARRVEEIRHLANANANLQAQVNVHAEEKRLVLASTRWRAMEPVWRVARALTPPQRALARRVLKAGWWAVTPWRAPARLRALRQRGRTGPDAISVVVPANATAAGQRVRRTPGARPSGVPLPSTERPTLSFVLAAGDDALALSRTISSLVTQGQKSWEVVVYDVRPELSCHSALSVILKGDCRIRCAPIGSGLGAAVDSAAGDFVAILSPGDLLVPFALDEVAGAIGGSPEADIFYSDEDRRSDDDVACEPYLKPSWSPDLLHAFNYFGRLTLLSLKLVREIGGIEESAGAAVEWDLNLRAADHAQTIRRIPRVLCHRAPDADAGRPMPDSPAAADARRVIERYWSNRGFQPTARTNDQGIQIVNWPIAGVPLVSVIVPTKDKGQLLRIATAGILRHTDYSAIELIIVDTGSEEKGTLDLYDEIRLDPRVKIVGFTGPFNYSAACNHGASCAQGELLLFLNNDVEVIRAGWLADMVRYATLPGVGCVGTKLIFPSLELQHGGVGVGPHLAALMYRGERMDFGVFGSPDHPRNWLAIMGACQMVTRAAFDTVGGFDESYQIAMSDVALCVHLWRAGYRTVYVPSACLIHHEGATRGHSNPPEDVRRLADDIRALGIDEDPYLHPELDGAHATPRLRIPGSEGPMEALRRHIVELGSFSGVPAELDLAHDGHVLAAVDRTRLDVLWEPQPACKVVETWSAARWCLDLLRRRPDIRARFPRALSEGADGAFARWLVAEGSTLFGLPPGIESVLEGMFAADLGRRARRTFMAREDLRRQWPHGLTPAGRLSLFRWYIQHGRREERLRLEEIWWLFWEASECPEREIVQAFLFTPAWQSRFPDAATPFGVDRFARWFAASYRIEGSWLCPARWPLPGTPGDQIRVAWRCREDWQRLHPNALRDVEAARAFLEWLADGPVPLEKWVRAWVAALDARAIAEEITRPGVNVLAHFRYPSGLRISAEALVEGLAAVGVGTSLRDVRADASDDPGHERYDGFEAYDVTVIHAQPEPFFESAYQRADVVERRPRTYRVAYWYWEFSVIPESWRRQAAVADEVWAATEFVANGLRERLSIPVRTLFPGVRIAPFEKRERVYFGLSGDEKVFLFVFHMMSVMERKNPLGLIRAFRRAFRPDEAVRLVIKTSFGERHRTQMGELRDAAQGARITIIDEVYSPQDVLALMDCCDFYVSLHRSEGLGLSMAEAMLMGKPVIATGYSGNTQFMNADNSLLVDYRLVKLGRPIPPYDADLEWAEPSEEHAAELMRRLYDDPMFARELGERAKEDAGERLSVVAAGRRIAARLAEIDAERFPQSHA